MTASILLSAITALSVVVRAQNNGGSDIRKGYGIGLVDANNFCLIVPDAPGDGKNTNYIASYDSTGFAACLGDVPLASPSISMPSGFISSAHYLRSPYYTQVTGTYDPAAYGLSPNDYGTQWDNSLASQGGVEPWSGCGGFPAYLEFLGGSQFCVRCCNYAYSTYCNPSNDTQGCESGIPGNYGPGFDNVIATSVAPPSKVLNGNDCSPVTDTCVTEGYKCCVANGDFAAGHTDKTTCQYPTGCKSGLSLPSPSLGAEEGLQTTSTTISSTTTSMALNTTTSLAATTSVLSTSTTSAVKATSTTAAGNSATPTTGSVASSASSSPFGFGIVEGFMLLVAVFFN